MGSRLKGSDDSMSLAMFQKEILAAARIAAKNPTLKMRDILEWSIGEVEPRDGEVILGLDGVGCNIIILKSKDRRTRTIKRCRNHCRQETGCRTQEK